MIKFILGISITLNLLSIICYIIIYKYSLKGLKHKIENYTLENLLDLDIGDDKNDFKSNSFFN
jgi:hypothetical protein